MDALASMSDNDILNATRQFESQARTLKNQITRINQETKQFEARIKENQEKIKLSTRMPYLVATVGELLTPIEEEDEQGSGLSRAPTNHGSRRPQKEEKREPVKAVVIKTSSRQSFYLPSSGLVDPSEMKPGELIAVNKESYNIYEKLPPEYDSRVKAMEVDERPTEEYSDIGGLDKQIEELVEAIVLPMT